jgi:ion channel-forming bestrophin family protein
MLATEKQGIRHLLQISMPYLIFSTVYSILVLSIEEKLGDNIYKVPGQIGSVFGLAVAFFLGFRMNSAYDRWWEARKIFGELTNNTRSFVTKIFVYVRNEKNIVEADGRLLTNDLIDLTMAYVWQLKNEMHNFKEPNLFADAALLFNKYGVVLTNKLSNEILVALTVAIEMHFSGLSNIEKSDLMQHINRFYEIQGKAERIKNTPFLKIYSAFTRIVVFIYVLLLPLFIGDIDLGGEKSTMELMAIPIMMVISSVFLVINRLANLFGEPFSENKTSVPIDAICKTIEKDCIMIKTKNESFLKGSI